MSRATHSAAICAFLVGLFTGTAGATPRKPTHIACVGDSITAGSGASDPSKNYVSLLQALEGNAVQVKNFGHSGATMLSATFGDLPYNEQPEYTAATDFVNKAGAGSVVSVVIILGANDSKPKNWDTATGKNDQQYLKDYRTLVDHFSGLASKPVVYVAFPLATGTNPCCTIRGDVIHDQEIPLIKQVAMEKHLPIIDLNTPTTGHPEYFGDGVHPNDSGYVVMANLVKKGLEREPSVNITSPSTGAMLATGMLPLTAAVAADAVDVSNVEFFEGATSLGKANAKPFTLIWPATPGQHSVTAKATDATLATGTSSAVTFTVAEGVAGSAGTGGVAASGGNGGVAGSAGGTGGTNAAAGQTAGGLALAGTTASAGTTAGAPAGQTDASCGCSLPGSRRAGGIEAGLLLASLMRLRARRRAARAFSGRLLPSDLRRASTPHPRAFRPNGYRE